MENWLEFFLILQMVIVILMIITILLQPSAADSLSGMGGGGMSNSGMGFLSGRAKSNALSKTTKWLAILFVGNCLAMGAFSGNGKKEAYIIQEELQQTTQDEPSKEVTVPIAE